MSHELVTIEQLPLIPEDWDYDASVLEVKQVIYKWKNLTVELATELYIAREVLTSQGMGRGFRGKTWNSYCQEIGVLRNTVNVWLSRWFETKGDEKSPPFLPWPNNRYRTIVIDPPWPMEKIPRKVRPHQLKRLDYPIMSIDEIKAFPISDLIAEDGCHIYLWTTHKFLPSAFEVFKQWSVNYECLLTWVKNVGFTPYSWMYSTEHVLFGRVGNLPVLKRGERLDFPSPVQQHSRKPKRFYELVRAVSPEPRIDIFSREMHDGFEQYGDETSKFDE